MQNDPSTAKLDQSSGSTGLATSIGRNRDPISDVLDTIRLQGAVFFLWEPRSPFGVGVADGERLSRHLLPLSDCIVSFHIVTEGPCWAAVHGEAPLRLETGDTLLLPRGDAYKIGDTPQFPSAADERDSIRFFEAMASGELPPIVADGEGPASNRLICGFLGCRLRPYNPLLASLPRMIRIPAPRGGQDPLSSLIDFAMTSARQSEGGERCLLLRLSEVMFVEVVRRHLRERSSEESGWLSAVQDPVIGRALRLLHAEPAFGWNLDRLAERVGASRSVLSERFRRLVGLPPMTYLTHWRMQVAANRMIETRGKIYTIARDVGYDSEAAFSRAFKRIVGTAPKSWRESAAGSAE